MKYEYFNVKGSKMQFSPIQKLFFDSYEKIRILLPFSLECSYFAQLLTLIIENFLRQSYFNTTLKAPPRAVFMVFWYFNSQAHRVSGGAIVVDGTKSKHMYLPSNDFCFTFVELISDFLQIVEKKNHPCLFNLRRWLVLLTPHPPPIHATSRSKNFMNYCLIVAWETSANRVAWFFKTGASNFSCFILSTL